MFVVAVGYLLAGIVLGGSIVRRDMLSSRNDVAKALGTDVATKGPRGSELEVVTPELLDRFPATVVGITEGDRIVVEDRAGMQQSVRLFAIDAPEHDQPFGAQSTEHLASLVSGKNVNLECENELSYEEIICKVFLPAGEDAGLAQLKAGMAWHYKQYEDEQSATGRALYAAAECTAMKSRIGLWSDPHPIRPWDFRHGTNSPLLFDASGCRRSSEPTSGAVVRNASRYIFEWPGCPYFSAIPPGDRVEFASPQAAEAAGYRPAHNCP